MKKIAQGIVRLRKLILTVAFLLLIPSAIGAIATRINYDILKVYSPIRRPSIKISPFLSVLKVWS